MCFIRETIKKILVATCAWALLLNVAYAEIGIAFSSGQGIREIVPYRVALSWERGAIWREEASWGLHFIWENSLAIWNGPQLADLGPDRVTDLHALTTGPMFRWQRGRALGGTHIVPYAEAGIGLSWLSETEIQGRILSLHFQFEDKGGMGIRFGNQQQYDVALRAYHYSNASIKRPNSGVNLAMISIGMWFPH